MSLRQDSNFRFQGLRASSLQAGSHVGPDALQARLSLSSRPQPPRDSDTSREDFLKDVAAVKDHIQAGDVFQLVLSQRFRRRTFADPFEIYRCAWHALPLLPAGALCLMIYPSGDTVAVMPPHCLQVTNYP